MSQSLSVIVPCYNEACRLKGFFELIRRNIDLGWQWIFVNDGSTDDTGTCLTAFQKTAPESIRVVSLPGNQGKGAAVRAGLLAADRPMAGYIDADLAASPLEFSRFMAQQDVASGQTLLLGIRLKTQDGKVQRLLYRHIMGRVFQTFTSVVTGLTVYDTQCGFKLMTTARARQIANEMACDGFAFDVELIMLAERRGMQVREELIPWQEKGDSRVRPGHILEMVWDICRIRRRIRKMPQL